jgi:hypothetical protein
MYFEMSEIIIDTDDEKEYQFNKSETMKFFERDYRDKMLAIEKIERKVGSINK